MNATRPAILLTGASGYIGSAVLRRLLAAGERVICVSHRQALPADCAAHPACESITVDLTDARSATALKDKHFDRVIHLAGLSRAHPAQMQAINVQGTEQLLAAASVAVTHFLYVSTQDAASDTQTVYGDSKRQAERLIEASGVPYSIARPGLVYGDGGGALRSVAGFARRWHLYPRPGSGQQCWQPVHVGDLADWLVQAIALPPMGTVALAGSRAVSQQVIFSMTLQAAGVRAWPVPLPMALLRLMRVVLGFHPLAKEMLGKLILNAGDRLLPADGRALPRGFPDEA
ncbi:MAG TPA: NAD(P)-dependent oxidoreductase [Pseudomonadales bacterium]